MRAVRKQLDDLRSPYLMFNQRDFTDWSLSYAVTSKGVSGTLSYKKKRYPLSEIHSIYARLMDDRFLPELEDEPEGSYARRHCRSLHDTLTRWIEVSDALVVNRLSAMNSNSSKPYQSQLIRRNGFRTPITLVTNDPRSVRVFWRKHKRIIYKSASGARSIVSEFTKEDCSRLAHIRWCPTMFQEFVDGTNIRVHTINNRVFATAAETTAIDYRYARQQVGTPAQLREVVLSATLKQRCLRLARDLGLEFAGIDLKVTPDDQVYCFEVNPSPAFSYYESSTGQPIAAALACHLTAR
jgi:glutathione synthase/RimK-type ligase-like ATP-grasp enzyme